MQKLMILWLPAAAAAVVVTYGTATSGGPDPFAYRDSGIVAAGKEIYVAQCASCHGASLEGQPNWRERGADGYLPAPPHDETGHTWHHPDAQLFEITRLGTETVVGGGYRSQMIGFNDVLTDDEIRAVLAYIKSTWPARIIERHDGMNEAYEAAN